MAGKLFNVVKRGGGKFAGKLISSWLSSWIGSGSVKFSSAGSCKDKVKACCNVCSSSSSRGIINSVFSGGVCELEGSPYSCCNCYCNSCLRSRISCVCCSSVISLAAITC